MILLGKERETENNLSNFNRSSSPNYDAFGRHLFTFVWTHLQEPRDVPLVVDAHGNHVLEHPEEWPVLSFFWLGLAQQTVELEEQPPCAFWSNKNTVSG